MVMETHNLYFSFSLRIMNAQRFPDYVRYGLKTRSNTERDNIFATYSTEERKRKFHYFKTEC